jgi:hypothetical protein
MPRCAANKPDGTPCERIVGASQSHCYAHDPAREHERKRNASRGGKARGNGELSDLKKRVKELAAGVLQGEVETGRAAVANQLYNTLIRAIEQERKQRELEEMAERLEALEEILKGRKGA